MRIANQSPSELIVKDSGIWISVLCAVAALALILFGSVQAKASLFLVAALFLLFAAIAAQSVTFTFDGIQRIVRWSGYKFFMSTSGSILFDDINDIATEAIAGQGGTLSYRLAILTAQGATPMAYAYSPRRDGYAALRAQILEFIRPGLHRRISESQTPSFDAIPVDLESSLRSLLSRGRKTDAISLLRSRRRIVLKEAVRQIDAIGEKVKADDRSR